MEPEFNVRLAIGINLTKLTNQAFSLTECSIIFSVLQLIADCAPASPISLPMSTLWDSDYSYPGLEIQLHLCPC
jgi:hypothetical protein